MTDLTLQDSQDEETSEDEQGSQDMPTKKGIGLKTTRLNGGSHRVIGMASSSASAASGELQIGEEITSIDNTDLANMPKESGRSPAFGSPRFERTPAYGELGRGEP